MAARSTELVEAKADVLDVVSIHLHSCVQAEHALSEQWSRRPRAVSHILSPCLSAHSQLLPRLNERREAIQKEVLKYGEAPAGIKEVFELCRGFERAYVHLVNVSLEPCQNQANEQ